MDYVPYRRPTPREATFTPFSYSKSPSTTIAPTAMPRKGLGAASPLLHHDPNEPVSTSARQPKSIADLGAEVRPTTSQKYHNYESVPSDWPKQGVKRVAPVEHREHHVGLRMVRDETVNANARRLNIVGSAAISVPWDNKELTRPLSGVKCRAQPHREDGWMHPVVPEAQRPHTTTSMEIGAATAGHGDVRLAIGHDENPEVVFRSEHQSAWSHTLSRLERFRIVVCDHALHRSGGPAAFYCALVRGQIGGLKTPRAAAPSSLFGYVDESRDRKLTIESLRDQLVALTGQHELEVEELAYLLYGVRPGERFPQTVTFRDFVEAFGKVPQTPEMACFKI